MKTILQIVILALITNLLIAQETISFKSIDDLIVTADLYVANSENSPFIILFHQAGWSRGEYVEIAPKLNELGFNCMAVDQRSGGGINSVNNETNKLATEKGLETKYIHALPDMQAALNYAIEKYTSSKIIIWGSSYSSSLVIKLASQNIGEVDGVLAFSPGEYFSRMGESETFIQDAAKNIEVPVFITSAKNEGEQWDAIFNAIPDGKKTSFLPIEKGNHGARALWEKNDDHEEYWAAVKKFLSENF
jgi:dienelactone hydrolase